MSDELIREIQTLRSQLSEAQEVIRAIGAGDVDAVVVSGVQGEQVFTLKGAEYAYRVLVEAMNEGAATLSNDRIVLYCNQRLANLVGIPLEQIIGQPVAQLVADEDRLKLQNLLADALGGAAARDELELRPIDGRGTPAYVSLSRMKGDDPAALCMVVTDLTKQKERDELLVAKEKLRKQAELIKLSFDAIIVWSPESGIESWSVGAELMYGFPEHEVLGRGIHELLAPVYPKPWSEIEAELQEKGFWKGEVHHRARDNRNIVASVRNQIIRDADGTMRVLEIARDITARKRAEDALRESESAFTTLSNLVPQLVWMCTPDGLNVYFNQRWMEYTGLTLEQSLGRGWNTPFHPEDSQGAWNAWDHAIQTGEQYRVESRLRAADGSYRWFLMRAEPLRNTIGEIVRWFGTCTDIEDLKQAEQVLQAQRRLIETVVNHLPCSVAFLRGRDLSFQLVNPNYQALSPERPMIGRTIEEVWPEAQPLLAERCRAVLESGIPFNIVDEPFSADRTRGEPQESVYYSWSLHRVSLPGQDGYDILITAWETTDRKRAELALVQSEKLASVGRMASTIAHEINNPLEAIGNAVYLAMTDPDNGPQAKSYLEVAVEQLDRVAHVTKQTLAFHHENKHPALMDLRQNINALLRLFAPRLKARGITIEERCAEVAPIMATSSEVQQVVSNLLSNSMDAMSEPGKIYLRISRSTTRNDTKGLRFTIADTGSGIPPEALKRIFEPFFTTKEIVGTGLGLWVTKQIAEKYGATIRVRSKLGYGTAFSVLFPLPNEVESKS